MFAPFFSFIFDRLYQNRLQVSKVLNCVVHKYFTQSKQRKNDAFFRLIDRYLKDHVVKYNSAKKRVVEYFSISDGHDERKLQKIVYYCIFSLCVTTSLPVSMSPTTFSCLFIVTDYFALTIHNENRHDSLLVVSSFLFIRTCSHICSVVYIS
jgi:hypothetical protein